MELGWKEEKRVLSEKIAVLVKQIKNQHELFELTEKNLKNGEEKIKQERDELLKRVEDLVKEIENMGKEIKE